MRINPELKAMWRLAFPGLLIILVVINLFAWLHTSQHVTGVSYASQVVTENRLRHANIKHSSVIGGEHKHLTSKDHVKLIAVKKRNLVYVVTKRHVVYALHAKVNLKNGHAGVINDARGQQNTHVVNGKQITASTWTSFGSAGYIESPETVNGQKVRGNWLKQRTKLTNTILVSRPDAHWLQKMPKGTAIVVQ